MKFLSSFMTVVNLGYSAGPVVKKLNHLTFEYASATP